MNNKNNKFKRSLKISTINKKSIILTIKIFHIKIKKLLKNRVLIKYLKMMCKI